MLYIAFASLRVCVFARLRVCALARLRVCAFARWRVVQHLNALTYERANQSLPAKDHGPDTLQLRAFLDRYLIVLRHAR